MVERRLPYRDNDEDEPLAQPCAVCGTMVPTWNDFDHIPGQPVYCREHKPQPDLPPNQ